MVTFAEDLSFSDPVAQSFKSSKSSSLNPSQVDNDDAPNQRKKHLLAVSSFLFALIWGFGAHLPSRYLQERDWEWVMLRAEMDWRMEVKNSGDITVSGGGGESGICECITNGTVVTI